MNGWMDRCTDGIYDGINRRNFAIRICSKKESYILMTQFELCSQTVTEYLFFPFDVAFILMGLFYNILKYVS